MRLSEQEKDSGEEDPSEAGRDAPEAKSDFGSTTGNDIFRNNVVPRRKINISKIGLSNTVRVH